MTPSVRILPAADRDLDEQADYLANAAGLETALRFYDSAASTFEAIARMPGIGEPWKSPRLRLAGLRACAIQGFENHLAFYRAVEGGIEVVRVLHGSRDIEIALESTPLRG
jgi:toxin ParE1/3/4